MSGSYRPLIAVVGYHLAPGRVTRWPDGGYGVPGPYIDALRRSGARVLIVSPGETNDPEEILAPFDGLLLVGGGDVDPPRYGGDATRGAHVRRRARPRPARDRPAARRRPPRPPDARHLSRDAGDERRVRRHAAPAPPRHPGDARARRPGRRHGLDPRREAGAPAAGCWPRPGSASSRARRTTTRASIASATACSRPVGATTAWSRRSSAPWTTPTRTSGCSASSGIRRTPPRTIRHSRRSSTASSWSRSGAGRARNPARPTGAPASTAWSTTTTPGPPGSTMRPLDSASCSAISRCASSTWGRRPCPA